MMDPQVVTTGDVFQKIVQTEALARDFLEALSSSIIPSNELGQLLDALQAAGVTSYSDAYHAWILETLGLKYPTNTQLSQVLATSGQVRDCDPSPMGVLNGTQRHFTISDIPITVKSKKKKKITLSNASASSNENQDLGFDGKLDDKRNIGAQLWRRMGDLYADLVLLQSISIHAAVHLLASICSKIGSGEHQLAGSSASNGFEGSITLPLITAFADAAMEKLTPLVAHLGSPMARSFVAMACLPCWAAKPSLRGLLDDMGDLGSDDAQDDIDLNTSLGMSDIFIRPFREDVDSRLEYTTKVLRPFLHLRTAVQFVNGSFLHPNTAFESSYLLSDVDCHFLVQIQVESLVYNEREQLFDAFSNLLHAFLAANRSDIDGSKVASVWRDHLSICKAKARLLELMKFGHVTISNVCIWTGCSPSRLLIRVVWRNIHEVAAILWSQYQQRHERARAHSELGPTHPRTEWGQDIQGYGCIHSQ